MDPVTFPGLGLEFNINRVAISIGGFDVYWYGIIISFGFLLAVVLALRDSKRFGIRQDDILDLILISAPVAIVGARIYYVIFSWSEYASNPINIFNVRQGGLAIYGGIIAGVLTAWIVVRVKKMNVWNYFDFLVIYLPLAQAIGRWGNFINHEAFGEETNLPWRMGLMDQGIYRQVHPTFLYESLWNFGLFFLLYFLRKKKKVPGEIFMMCMSMYGFGRCMIEGLRTDSLWVGPLRVSQLLGGLLFVVFAVMIIVRRKKYAGTDLDITTIYLPESRYYGYDGTADYVAAPKVEEVAGIAAETLEETPEGMTEEAVDESNDDDSQGKSEKQDKSDK